ncbi:thiamine biosynthesis protein [Coprinellus micaceus]|uniref:Thiamine biosynthesis protein n=1 Tax=Coprinellus micaceus TaxID=71717 RepID=A0A4Y7TJ51_COPMI|nr:thiamine biosynthesis protein [Coprinellus micaceus]
MLCNAEISLAVSEALTLYKNAGKPIPIVCDPVCVSTSGHTLLEPGSVDVLLDHLFPISTLLTPNKSETELLLSSRGCNFEIETLDDLVGAATRLSALSDCSVLVKGEVKEFSSRHPEVEVIKQNILEENMEILLVGQEGTQNRKLVVDVLHQPEATVLFCRPRIDSTSTHGTGCTLSSAITCRLAQGFSVKDAVAEASLYTYLGILTARPMGKGFGPLNHLHSVDHVAIPSPTQVNPYPFTYHLIQGSRQIWKEYVEHDFVKLLGKGILPKAAFAHFIKQDYHYLKYYARAYGLLAAKSSSFGAIQSATETIMNVINEIATHKTFCQSFGISPEELESTPESTATTAYGAYILNVGLQGDHAKLVMALMACLLGYGEVGLWLKKEASLPSSWVAMEGNPYRKWIEDYSGVHYQNAVRIGIESIEKLVVIDHPSPARLKEWEDVWLRCAELEKGFWDAAMAQA